MGKLRGWRFTPLLLALAAVALLAAGCTAAPRPTVTTTADGAGAVSPGKVTVLTGSFGNDRFDRAFSSTGDEYARIIHGFLISSDVQEGRKVISPGIASKWGISADGKTWALTIRKGVKFHDGTGVTAEDVLWTLRHIMGPQAGDYALSGLNQTLAAQMDRIEQTGPDEVRVITRAPVPDMAMNLSEAGQTWLGAVYPKRATLHDQKEEEAYDRNPIGAGIMKLVKHVPGDSMTFERFADYYQHPKNGFSTDQRVNFRQLELRVVPEEATRVAALRSREADIAPVSLATRQQVEAGGSRLVFAPEGGYIGVRQWGCWKPQYPCHGKRVRQALAYAIDKELMRGRLYGADMMQIKGWQFVTPSTIGYSKELDPLPFDTAKARQLLADAGYPGGRGFGQLVINAWVSRTLPFIPEAAQLVADSWKRELGLDVVVRMGDEAALKTAFRGTEDYFGQMLFWDNDTRIDASSITRSYYGRGSRLDRAIDDPELFDLVAKATAVIDPVEQEKALASLYLRLRDEQYDIGLGYFNIPWGVSTRIRTWQPYPLTNFVSGLHTITIE